MTHIIAPHTFINKEGTLSGAILHFNGFLLADVMFAIMKLTHYCSSILVIF